MRYTIVLLATLMGFITSCSGNEEVQHIVAESDIQTYSSPDREKSFVISKGEVCEAGKKKVTKEYQFLEVTCPGKGHAWVITGEPYRLEVVQSRN